MTALVSCFARAYHFKNNIQCIFYDSMEDKVLLLETATRIYIKKKELEKYDFSNNIKITKFKLTNYTRK